MMGDMSGDGTSSSPAHVAGDDALGGFGSALVDRVREGGNIWRVPGGEIRLPEVFGFCRGVKRALRMLQQAVSEHGRHGGRLFLLGEIIHNPWVNRHFEDRGVRVLTREQVENVGEHITPTDCAIIPAFGVKLPVEQRLKAIGCNIVDTSCGDVRRVWAWADRAARGGHAVLIFGRATHDETVVTTSRLAAAGAKYVVAGSLDETRAFCDLIAGRRPAEDFSELFGPRTTNAAGIEPFRQLAQVSQTTMLYDDTMAVRDLVREAFVERYGQADAERRLLFQPTVCRATQARQNAAVALCSGGPDLAVVVGGFGSSNTRHLYELASQYAPAWFIEDAGGLRGPDEVATIDLASGRRTAARDWLPARRPLTIALLAGASSPEIVVGEVLQRLADLLGANGKERA